VVEVYPHTKLDGNRKHFVDVRTRYGRTDGHTSVPIYYVCTSSVGDDAIKQYYV